MNLGERIRRARLEAGLSQRQLCGEEITRNMLSLIENGAAQPSMKTLKYLSERLGKPLHWFLEENAEIQDIQGWEWDAILKAEQALDTGRDRYAAQLLESVPETHPALLRQKLLLQARLPGAKLPELCEKLPSLDEELLLRAGAALEMDQPDRCMALLNAARNRESPRWQLLAGQLYLKRGDYAAAADHLRRVEEDYPETAAMLEICCRELGDFKGAYEYACKQKATDKPRQGFQKV